MHIMLSVWVFMLVIFTLKSEFRDLLPFFLFSIFFFFSYLLLSLGVAKIDLARTVSVCLPILSMVLFYDLDWSRTYCVAQTCLGHTVTFLLCLLSPGL